MKRMEEMLDRPLRELMPVLQDKFVRRTTYRGVHTQKNPFDLWAYQEIIHATRPDHIVEIGTLHGGSALALAAMLRAENLPGMVVTVDANHGLVPSEVKACDKIRLVTGEMRFVVDRVAEIVWEGTAMVVEDSSHAYDNTLAVLRTYSRFVKPGCYFVVEDTVCNHGLEMPKLNPGPYEAVQTFVKEDDRFSIDRDAEAFCLTWNPCGFLRRKL